MDLFIQADALKWAVKKYGNREIMGTREVIAELDEVQPNGKMFKKHQLGKDKNPVKSKIWILNLGLQVTTAG